MNQPALSRVATAEQPDALNTVTLAFAADPVERWLWPKAAEYLRTFPQFVTAFGGRAFDEQTAWKLEDGSAVALWLPPNARPDPDPVIGILTSSVAPHQHADMFAVLAQMDEAHPTYPHWYLPWLAVDPARQGRGLGSHLLQSGLDVVDRDHLPAYLETSNPRNVPLYQQHGFEITTAAQAGDFPPITCMLRVAR